MTNADETVILSVNGEIYNHLSLRTKLKNPRKFKTHSDCEVILYLWEDYGTDFLNMLDGFFSFVVYDDKKQEYLAARDPIGITTLYMGERKRDGSVWFASEMKALHEECDRIVAFPPGHYYSSKTKEIKPYYQPEWFKHVDQAIPTPQEASKTQTPEEEKAMYTALRTSLERAVKKRLMSEVPFGVLLSGGLDSSLIASITVRTVEKMRKEREDKLKSVPGTPNGKVESAEEMDETANALHTVDYWPRTHSFSVGLPGAPDLKYARKVADFLKTAHHEYTYEFQEGLDAIPDVIWHLETYDVTTIRASTPMYLLSRRIKSMGVKMVLSGEGSDEVFGGELMMRTINFTDLFRLTMGNK